MLDDPDYVKSEKASRVRCAFIVRTPSARHWGSFVYEEISLKNREGDGDLHTHHPPMVGDTIRLNGYEAHGFFKVIAREWWYADYGSTRWPAIERYPIEGPRLEILVESAPMQRQNEVLSDEIDAMIEDADQPEGTGR